MFLANFDISFPLRMKTFYVFLTYSIFTCILLLESIFMGFFVENFELSYVLNRSRAFDLIPMLRARPKYQLSCSRPLWRTTRNKIDGTTRSKIVIGQP